MVVIYKKQFEESPSSKDIREAKDAAWILINKFKPLFKKYAVLFKTGQINFNDSDTKIFIGTFIGDPRLRGMLKRQKKYSKLEYRAEVYKKFGFVLETYGQLAEEDIILDLQLLLLVLAKRYKMVGKNFCAYVQNCFRYEVSRHVKKYIENPLNITYKNTEYIDDSNGSTDAELKLIYEDLYYEPQNGIPDMNWIGGETCSDVFSTLKPIERKILVKYYVEEYNDKQIAEALGLHINTVNQKRRQAVLKLSEDMNIELDDVKRSRHSGV